MKVTVKLSGLPAGSCFMSGNRKVVKKKLQDGRIVTIDRTGKIRSRAQRGDPSVRPAPCPLPFIGVGLRRHPETVVEIGDGRPRRLVRRKLV